MDRTRDHRIIAGSVTAVALVITAAIAAADQQLYLRGSLSFPRPSIGVPSFPPPSFPPSPLPPPTVPPPTCPDGSPGIPAGGVCSAFPEPGELDCCPGLSCIIILGSGKCGVPSPIPCLPDPCGAGTHCCPGAPGASQPEGCCPNGQACAVLPDDPTTPENEAGNPGCLPATPSPSPSPDPGCPASHPVGCGSVGPSGWCCQTGFQCTSSTTACGGCCPTGYACVLGNCVLPKLPEEPPIT